MTQSLHSVKTDVILTLKSLKLGMETLAPHIKVSFTGVERLFGRVIVLTPVQRHRLASAISWATC